ncbi:MAG: DUF6916 family protein [Pirellulaceae bacterium]
MGNEKNESIDSKQEIDKESNQGFRDVSRRNALKALAASAAGAAAVSGLGVTVTASPAPGPLWQLHLSQWQGLVGELFQVAGEGVNARMRLEQVIENTWISGRDTRRPGHFRRESFSLLFSGPVGLPESGTWMVSHEVIGKSAMFMHRTVRDSFPDQVIYDVVIN